MKNILFVGLDVDDEAFHGCIFDVLSGEYSEFKVSPTASAVHKRLKEHLANSDVRICYEAGFLGFSLYRELIKFGYHCDVIAPSLIPEKASDRVKTDRLDAIKLARYYGANLLTAVNIPSEEHESHRRLLRSRKFLVSEATRFKNRITGICRALGWNYKRDLMKSAYWTKEHRAWLGEKIKEFEKHDCSRLDLEYLIRQLDGIIRCIEGYDLKIEEISNNKQYSEKVSALTCFRSIKVNTAMTLILEIGDVKRFNHPYQLTSYAGLDVTEHSSGGKEKKYQITGQGNKYIRSALVEACQTALNPAVVSRHLVKRRKK